MRSIANLNSNLYQIMRSRSDKRLTSSGKFLFMIDPGAEEQFGKLSHKSHESLADFRWHELR
jgi:hypothetical protein